MISFRFVSFRPGSISVGLAHAVGPTGLLMAVDVEKEVVKQCTRRFEEAGVSTFASSTVASVYHLNEHFEENTFDICYANQVLQHLSDPVKALREMKRVVKHPGGMYVFYFYFYLFFSLSSQT